MKNSLKHKIYSITQNLYYYILIVLGFVIFGFLFSYRFKIISFFNFNPFIIYLSIYIFYPILFLSLFFIFKPIKILKRKAFNKFEDFREPSFIEKYGKEYKEPTFEDFNLTKEEFKRHINIPKIDIEIISLILASIFVLYLASNQSRKLSELIYLVIGFILFIVLIRYFIKKVNKKMYLKNSPNRKAEQYLEALEIYHKIQEEKLNLKHKEMENHFF